MINKDSLLENCIKQTQTIVQHQHNQKQYDIFRKSSLIFLSIFCIVGVILIVFVSAYLNNASLKLWLGVFGGASIFIGGIGCGTLNIIPIKKHVKKVRIEILNNWEEIAISILQSQPGVSILKANKPNTFKVSYKKHFTINPTSVITIDGKTTNITKPLFTKPELKSNINFQGKQSYQKSIVKVYSNKIFNKIYHDCLQVQELLNENN